MSRMNKRKFHHVWTQLRRVKPWYFLVAAAIFGVLSIVGLRHNNQTMAELRQEVYIADKENGDVLTALTNLQAYVTAHMNTSLATGNGVYPPIQLQYTYERLVESQVGKLQTGNNDLYTEAQTYCQRLNPTDFSGRNRVPCIEKYVSEHGSGVVQYNAVPASLYQFDFLAPKWSPDMAGWSLVLTVLCLFLALGTWLLDRYFKRLVS